MQLEQRHIDALGRAETLMFHSDFCPYLELKELLADGTPQARSQFRILFTSFYGLNAAGLTDNFRDRYFDILFGVSVEGDGEPNAAAIVERLYDIRNRQGQRTLQFSFVSKLVSIHREGRPIYDRHVLKFFHRRDPAERKKSDRISWYVGFLNDVAANYGAWAQDVRVIPIVDRLKARDERLAGCHVVRLMDFLVWKVGNRKLL